MNKHSNFGYSTILLSFILICILTFTALTLLTANSDYKLSKKVADRNTAFYEAEELAYEDLGKLDQLLLQCYDSSPDEDTYWAAVADALSSSFDGDVALENNAMQVSFSKSITDNQYLEVSLSLSYPQNDRDTLYEIETWQSVHVDTPVEEQPLNLLGGNK